MDQFQYPLFFEARDLTDREKGKTWRYFQKRKDSGGGDCSAVEKVGGNTYKISFKDREDQERVLQRKSHTICLPGEELRLTVSRTESPQIPDQPTTSQQQAFKKTNTKCLEKIFRLDIFLMQYLRDSPKALKVLQKQLSSIGCTVEFDFDEEEAVVRGDVDKGPGGAFGGIAQKWELQVDRIFISLTEDYMCYHVLEPLQVKKLLQDRHYVTDDTRVYFESGYAVVVGEAEAVKEKMKVLEKSLPTRRELPVVEKHFRLVEEEFCREMCATSPEVTITRGTVMIILEGPDEKVHSGAAKLDELIKKIKQKRVHLSTDLLTFMNSSGAISKYEARFMQSFRNPVSLEIGSDLLLSSLSFEALNEAEVAVLRDLSVVTVQLQGAAAEAPDLNIMKEILTRAKNEANRGELRVSVSFIPGPSGPPVTTVQVVGYNEHVTKLKELLHDYQMNQVSTQETLNLSHPELVDCFEDTLRLLGMKQTSVTLKACHFPHPCVLLSGPRCRVQETHQALMSALASLTLDTLVLDGPGAQRFFQTDGKESRKLVENSCQVLIREQQGVHSANLQTTPQNIRSITTRRSTHQCPPSSVAHAAVNKINLKIKLCSLQDEQANVLVAPIVSKKLTSTNIGKGLLQKGGDSVKSTFDLVAATCSLAPGDVMQVPGSASMGCSKIFLIECSAWDGVRGNGVQALGNGLKRCLDLCVQQGFTSVAIPVIGPGIALKYPLKEAVQVLTEKICQFGSGLTGSLSTIHVVIKPGYPDSEECYHEVYKQLSSNINQGERAVFRPLTSDLDVVTMTAGDGITLEVVFGDITDETTDAVVNSTDFTNFQTDVCRDILTMGGPVVEAELKAAKVNSGDIFVSQPGSFPCKKILHVSGEKDASNIEGLACSIINHCEKNRLESVAIPAICAGVGGLDPGVVAGAILRGIKTATSSTLFYSLTNIRLVLIKINVFLEFKKEAMQTFVTLTNTFRVSVPEMPRVDQQLPMSLRADLSILQTTSTSPKSTFLFLGLCRKDVDDAMAALNNQFKRQSSTQTFRKEELEGLSQDDLMDLKQVAEAEDLYMQKDPSGDLTVTGLKDGVNKMMGLITAALHGSLRREMRVRNEEDLYARVAWCILGQNGIWERLPKADNHKLETKEIAGGIVDVHGITWSVNLQKLEATRSLSGQKAKLKRLENLSDFTFPLYWDSMAAGESLKRVALQPSSKEYRTVKEAFKRTVQQTVMKIERLQNIHLRRAYEAQKKHISEKNAQQGGAGEKFLYHGTTQDNCNAIIKTGFNRRFAGQNATAFGHGTYFAVNANYSAQPTYSKPAADGSQLMFVARVLTGVFTQGQSGMMVPPPQSQQAHDRYDSVVDKVNDPSMFVVFHDDQAYADYLITFK